MGFNMNSNTLKAHIAPFYYASTDDDIDADCVEFQVTIYETTQVVSNGPVRAFNTQLECVEWLLKEYPDRSILLSIYPIEGM